MNAYTTIDCGHRRPLKVRLRSRMYRRGLHEGFGATGLLVASREYKFVNSVDASIAGTWKAVGDAVRKASKSKEAALGKIPREAEPAE